MTLKGNHREVSEEEGVKSEAGVGERKGQPEVMCVKLGTAQWANQMRATPKMESI